MSVQKLAGVGPYDNNVYVVSSGGEALVVDASARVAELKPLLGGLRVVGLVITHGHPDHTVHVEELVDEFKAACYWGFKPYLDVTPLVDGQTLRVGDLDVRVMHTPGHTPDSACLYVDGDLITGDTLFPGGPGNTDGDPDRFAEVMRSLDRLFELPDETRVRPGHGADTTLGAERPHLGEWRARGW
jgi:glyoxylase-like metal-dependent hydrolase (beta-lactamase superfamily II)